MGGEVKGMKGLLLGSAALFLVVGCGSLTPFTGGGYKLYAAASNSNSMQLAVIDPLTQAVERNLRIGTPSSDWKHLYSVVSNSLVDADPQTGAAQRTLQLPRHYDLPQATISGVPGGMSQNGKWLVLQSFDETASVPSASHLLVVDTSFGSTPVQVELKGWFDFDAISNDGKNLYLIQYIAPQLYHVRLYHVALHQLDSTVIVEKGNSPNTPMAGVKLMSVPSPDGEWLFTLYARQNEGAFIHGLRLGGDPWAGAACIDLPGEGYNKDPGQFRWSLAVDPGNSRLYAVNGAMGWVGEIPIGGNAWPQLSSTSKIGSGRSASLSLAQNASAREFGFNASVVSPDGKTLITAAATGIVWLDTTTLRTRASALDGWHVWGLGLTPDGRTLYALNEDGQIAEVGVASAKVGARFNPRAGQPVALMRVA
jgi:DNA-binding beta-propeller fold protein YncE